MMIKLTAKSIWILTELVKHAFKLTFGSSTNMRISFKKGEANSLIIVFRKKPDKWEEREIQILLP